MFHVRNLPVIGAFLLTGYFVVTALLAVFVLGISDKQASPPGYTPLSSAAQTEPYSTNPYKEPVTQQQIIIVSGKDGPQFSPSETKLSAGSTLILINGTSEMVTLISKSGTIHTTLSPKESSKLSYESAGTHTLFLEGGNPGASLTIYVTDTPYKGRCQH
jgi:plastocyanin